MKEDSRAGMIKWVVFDLGGVLLDVDFGRVVNRFTELTRFSEPEVAGRLAPLRLFERLGVGAISVEAACEEVRGALGTHLTDLQIVEASNRELGDLRQDTRTLIGELRSQVQVSCLSNTNAVHWEALIRHYGILELFESPMASQILQLAKPGQEIYDRAAAVLGSSPDALLFIDDRLENVLGAQQAGWHATHYRGDAELRSVLCEYGLLTKNDRTAE